MGVATACASFWQEAGILIPRVRSVALGTFEITVINIFGIVTAVGATFQVARSKLLRTHGVACCGDDSRPSSILKNDMACGLRRKENPRNTRVLRLACLAAGIKTLCRKRRSRVLVVSIGAPVTIEIGRIAFSIASCGCCGCAGCRCRACSGGCSRIISATATSHQQT